MHQIHLKPTVKSNLKEGLIDFKMLQGICYCDMVSYMLKTFDLGLVSLLDTEVAVLYHVHILCFF